MTILVFLTLSNLSSSSKARMTIRPPKELIGTSKKKMEEARRSRERRREREATNDEQTGTTSSQQWLDRQTE